MRTSKISELCRYMKDLDEIEEELMPRRVRTRPIAYDEYEHEHVAALRKEIKKRIKELANEKP